MSFIATAPDQMKIVQARFGTEFSWRNNPDVTFTRNPGFVGDPREDDIAVTIRRQLTMRVREAELVDLTRVSEIPAGDKEFPVTHDPYQANSYSIVIPPGKGAWFDFRSMLVNATAEHAHGGQYGWHSATYTARVIGAVAVVQMKIGNVDVLTGEVCEGFQPLRLKQDDSGRPERSQNFIQISNMDGLDRYQIRQLQPWRDGYKSREGTVRQFVGSLVGQGVSPAEVLPTLHGLDGRDANTVELRVMWVKPEHLKVKVNVLNPSPAPEFTGERTRGGGALFRGMGGGGGGSSSPLPATLAAGGAIRQEVVLATIDPSWVDITDFVDFKVTLLDRAPAPRATAPAAGPGRSTARITLTPGYDPMAGCASLSSAELHAITHPSMPFSSMGGAGGPGGAGGGGYGYPPLGSAVAPLRPFVFAPALAASAPPAFPILSDAESRAIEQSATKAFWASCGAVPRLKERMSELKTSLRAIVAFETDPTFRLFPIIWVTATATSLNDILSNERLVPSKSQLETIARDFDSVVTQIAAGVFPESNDYAHEVKPHVDRAISLLGEIQKALDTEIQMQTDAALAERLSAIEL